MNLNTEPKIVSLANSLDLDVNQPVEAIMKFCHAKVSKFIRRVGRMANIQQLQRVICEQLNLKVEEIWTNDQVESLASRYREQNEIGVYAAIKTQLKPDTFGMLTKLDHLDHNNRVTFVAFIDCRGEKHLRRAFTLWHEIAHCLTAEDQLALPLRRTTAETLKKDAIEKLTDIIAGDFAFYEPLFTPILEAECGVGRLTFRIVDRIRNRFNPEASFISTLQACVTHAPKPTIFLEVGLALRKKEQREIALGLAQSGDFTPHLRVLRSVGNSSAKCILPHIPKQMRVPSESIMSKFFDASLPTHKPPAHENLQCWVTSDGKKLPNLEVAVEARKFGDGVLGLVSAQSEY